MKNGKVMTTNGELYFESTGKGEPLILIHAGFSDRRDWQHQVADFAKKFNVITYDQRGSGNSSVPATAFSPADDLHALMVYLNIERAILVGHSIGGTIALDFALQYPQMASALILVASGLNGYIWSQEYQEWMKGIWESLQPEEMMKQALSASFYAVAMSDPNIKSAIETITKESIQKILTWETFNVHDVQWFFPDPLLKLKELKIPGLVMYGDKDSQDIKKIAQIISETLPKVKVVQIENVDHLLNFEKPTELGNLVFNFLSETGVLI